MLFFKNLSLLEKNYQKGRYQRKAMFISLLFYHTCRHTETCSHPKFKPLFKTNLIGGSKDGRRVGGHAHPLPQTQHVK